VNFELTDEQAMLREASRSLLRDQSSMEQVRRRLDDGPDVPADVDPTLWRLAAELGWAGIALPEEYGGSGQGLVELSIVAQEIGRALARGPFLPTVLVGNAVARAGSPELRAEVLPALADGSASASWAFAEPGAPWTLDGIRMTTTTSGDTIVLDGIKTAVQDADSSRWLVVTALYEGEPTSFLVDRDTPGLSVRRQHVLDLTRSFYKVRLDGVRVPASRKLDGGPAAIQRLLDVACVLYGAEAIGVMDRMLALTVEYLKVRVQFGTVIGTFQAVKHKCATMAMLVHGSRAALDYAAMATDAGAPDASQACCVAASFISSSVGDVAGEALQLHGGIGFTWEHDLHLHLRRAKVDGVLYGDAAVHRERLCGLLQRTLAAL